MSHNVFVFKIESELLESSQHSCNQGFPRYFAPGEIFEKSRKGVGINSSDLIGNCLGIFF
jgi:hypothetical protein